MVIKKIYYADIETSEFVNSDKYQEFFYKKRKFVDDSNIHYELKFILGCIIRYNEQNDKIIEKYHTFNQEFFSTYLIDKCNKKIKTIIYFHNLSFDSKFFIDDLYKSFEKIELIQSGSKLISIQCKIKIHNKKSKNGYSYRTILEFRDSLSILLISLKKLGDMVNLPKLDIKFDKCSKKELEIYCYRDCEIIYFALKDFVKSINEMFSENIDFVYEIRHLKFSIASISKFFFEKIYPNIHFKVSKKIESEFRKFFFGGRVECFNFNKTKNLFYFDINSLYPSEMSKRKFCNNQIFVINNENDYTIEQLIEIKETVAYIVILKENQHFPIYPLRIGKKLKQKVFFCNGVKKCFVSKYEIKELIKMKVIPSKIQILKVKRIVVCKNQLNFSKFVKPLYKVKSNPKTSKGKKHHCKIFLNSSFGKFGQNPEREKKEFIPEFNFKKIKTQHELDNIIELNGYFYKSVKFFNSNQTCNLINGCLTTNYSRFTLWKQLYYNYNHGIDNHYCDTDSITSKNFNLRLLDDYKLGFWKKEHSFEVFQCIDSKEYYFYTKKDKKKLMIKLKGFNTKNIKELKQLRELYKTEKLNHRIDSILMCLRQKINFESASLFFKSKKSYYYKRIIDKNTLKTKPINLSIDNIQKVRENNELILKKLIHKLFL